MTMKIENYADSNAYTTDTFTFQHNPRTFDDALTKFQDVRKIKYAFTLFGLTDPLKSPRQITIAGHFDGANKETNYRYLAKHCNESKLKSLYFGTDKFLIVVPTACKRVQSGGRTNFIDYVASFISPFGILFESGTPKTGSNASAEKNEGNVPTPIEKITGTVTGGSLVTIKDKYDNGIKFTPTGAGSQSVSIYLISQVDSSGENSFTQYLYALIGTTQQSLDNANSAGSRFIKLNADESLSTLFTGSTPTGITSPVFQFRDGFSSD